MTSDGLRGKIDPEYVTSWIGQSILTREYHGSVTEAIKRLAPHLDASVMKATERRGSKIKEHSNTIERFKKDLAGVDPSSGFLLTAKYCREELGLYLFRSKFGMNPENVARELAPQLISSISYSPKRRRIGLPASSKTPTSQAAPEPPIQSTSVIHYENITAQYCKGKRYMVRLGVTKAMDAMRWLDEYPHQNINADDICRFEGLYSNFMVAAMATKLAESGRKSIAHSKNHLMYELARYIDGKVMEADKPKEESAGRGKSKWVFAKRPSREPNPNYR